MPETIISIKNIHTGYQNQKVLDNVSLNINSNDFIGVIGPNGGGKTTLVKSILGSVPLWSGEITLNIKKSEIGYLPQTNDFDKQFPIIVGDVILSGLSGKKGIWKRYLNNDITKAQELAEQAGISDIFKKPIGKLSGGQMQRALLCRALINEPKLLILDEPGTYVDSKFEMKLYDWLADLNKNMAILMISHDLGTISSKVKTIACVNKHLHYHESNKITAEQLAHYECPIQIITHGEVPHQVLAKHKH